MATPAVIGWLVVLSGSLMARHPDHGSPPSSAGHRSGVCLESGRTDRKGQPRLKTGLWCRRAHCLIGGLGNLARPFSIAR